MFLNPNGWAGAGEGLMTRSDFVGLQATIAVAMPALERRQTGMVSPEPRNRQIDMVSPESRGIRTSLRCASREFGMVQPTAADPFTAAMARCPPRRYSFRASSPAFAQGTDPRPRRPGIPRLRDIGADQACISGIA